MPANDICSNAGIVLDYHANDHIDPPYSHVWVWSMIGALVIMVVKARLHRAKELRRAKEADEVFDPKAPLGLGQRFISGKVEFAEGAEHAVEVHVRQSGSQTKTKNGWTHSWREVGRVIHAQPFYVRHSSGERVRVEPGADVLLVDNPDQMIWKEKEQRVRIAALTPNENVIVEGALSRAHDPETKGSDAYRGHHQGWIMRPARGERMHLSAENLSFRHVDRASKFADASKHILLVVAFVNLLSIFYLGNLLGGYETCAYLQKKDTYITKDSKGRTTTHYRVQLVIDDPAPLRFERNLDDDDWDLVNAGDTLAFRYVAAWPSASSPGAGTSINAMSTVFSVIAMLIGWGIYGSAVGYRRWYEGKLDDSGSGELPEPPTTTEPDGRIKPAKS